LQIDYFLTSKERCFHPLNEKFLLFSAPEPTNFYQQAKEKTLFVSNVWLGEVFMLLSFRWKKN
jgi:hypothetical protein